MPKQKKTTYKVREIMARWRQGYLEKEIADALRTTEIDVETVISENRKPGENDSGSIGDLVCPPTSPRGRS